MGACGLKDGVSGVARISEEVAGWGGSGMTSRYRTGRRWTRNGWPDCNKAGRGGIASCGGICGKGDGGGTGLGSRGDSGVAGGGCGGDSRSAGGGRRGDNGAVGGGGVGKGSRCCYAGPQLSIFCWTMEQD